MPIASGLVTPRPAKQNSSCRHLVRKHCRLVARISAGRLTEKTPTPWNGAAINILAERCLVTSARPGPGRRAVEHPFVARYLATLPSALPANPCHAFTPKRGPDGLFFTVPVAEIIVWASTQKAPLGSPDSLGAAAETLVAGDSSRVSSAPHRIAALCIRFVLQMR